MSTDSKYYNSVKSRPRLHKAWKKVYENGIKSKSLETKSAVFEFNKKAPQHIENIYRHLLKRKFQFSPARGIPIKRPGKKDRPIIVARLEDRIVKRSILDVLHDEPNLKPYFLTPTSFGGIKDFDEMRGVKNAVKVGYKLINNGATWFIRSDIHDFFTNIPREKVLKIISTVIKDKEFNELMVNAVNVELENLLDLGQKKNLFPIYEIGVAQGCCLSPLFGNILLHDFDSKMNGRGITCLRYIDDFLILGHSPRHVKAALKSAILILKSHGLTAYDPLYDKDKADIGATQHGLEFLGCEILPGLIRPSKKSRKRLIDKMDNIIDRSTSLMASPEQLYAERRSLVQTLVDMSNVIMGWGNQYSFCNDTVVMNNLDHQINKRITNYMQIYLTAKKYVKSDSPDIRRLLGVQLLTDCKQDPII